MATPLPPSRDDPWWLDLPGVPETVLDDPTRRQLAAAPAPPPPPWRTVVSAVLWWHRSTPAAVDRLDGAARSLRRIPVTVGALVRYGDSPVGCYSEVFASPLLVWRGAVPSVTIPFIAVDSPASIAGGRAGWGLPKALAAASWDGPGDGQLAGEGWRVGATASCRGPALPLAGLLPVVQPQPDGSLDRSTVRLRGRARWGRVAVSTDGPSLPDWLRAGWHPGLAIVGGRMHITAPRPA